ncbi:MAG: penicillin-binding protein 2 [Candidatus Nomurabacteria bacterium]|jgi:cell division protein FtsI/penicillin-binding protein 2|nr:penicillin-binding protein 2 [Candidatus Nomurabacteria bacterium]
MIGLKKGNRIGLLAVAMMGVFAVLVGRLFVLQVVEHKKWQEIAEAETMRQLVLPAKRGEIYFSDQKTIAPAVLNEAVWTVFVDPVAVVDGAQIKKVLTDEIGGKMTADLDEVLAMASDGVRYRVVARELNFTEATKVKEAELYGVGLVKNTKRSYPQGDVGAQVLGFVNQDGEGQYGVEGAWDDMLGGKDGVLKTVTDVNNIPLTIGNNNIKEPATDGKNIVLTIDLNIQAQVEKILREKAAAIGEGATASAVVIDPRTGNVLAMGGYPSFDPAAYWNATNAAVYNNPAATLTYEPGSVMKSFTMGTGIDLGLVMPSDTFYNSDRVQVGDATITNSTLGHTGRISFQTAIDFSLNTGMVEVLRLLGGSDTIGNKLGRERLYEYFHDRFGFGASSGSGLYEAGGLIYAPDSEYGNAVQYANMTFGQGMSATLLQVASAFGGLIGDGVVRQSRVVDGYYDAEGGITKIESSATLGGSSSVDEKMLASREAVSAATAATVRKMLVAGRKVAFKGVDGWILGGKTGTSETIGEDGAYNRDTTEASYLGFGGRVDGGFSSSDDGSSGDGSTLQPSFVVMVHLHKDGANLGGGTDAEPVFYEIVRFLGGYLR